MRSHGPTPRAEWVKVGELCDIVASEPDAMCGVVLRIVQTASVPYAVVRWPTSIGRHTISTLQRARATGSAA